MSKFSAFDLGTETEFSEAISNKPKYDKEAPKFLQPGLQVLVIDSVKEGVSKTDPTWLQLELNFKGNADHPVRYYLMVPTSSKFYGPDQSLGSFRMFAKFCESVGIKLDPKSFVESLEKWFSDPQKLVGLKAECKIGSQAYSHKYVSKHLFHLVDKKGAAVCDMVTSQPIEFPERGAVEEYCKMKGYDYNSFPEISGFGAPQELPKERTKLVKTGTSVGF